MKYVIYLCCLMYLTSCTWSGVRTPATEQKGRHYVITLHGVRGNDKSYGDFHSIIKQNLEKVDPGYVVENFNWTFPVGEKVVETKAKNGRDLIWTPHQISKKFNQDFFLGANAMIPNMGPNDKISLIAYSMGGLMAMSWYYDTMFNFAGTGLEKYSADQHSLLLSRLERVENVIGLGAVYWGSLDAELGWTFLEKGEIGEIKKSIPKIKEFCLSANTKKVIEGESLLSTAGSLISGLWGSNKGPTPTVQQKNEKFVKDSVLAACQAVKLVDGNFILNNIDTIAKPVLDGIKSGMTSVGNVCPHELDIMRLTSDVINEMRIGRVKHVLSNELRTRFKAKWTSIVGVFPCLGKKDKGLTCTEFVSEDYKLVNEGLVGLFSGLYRRETDGPVISPSAVADFLFYVEPPGQETKTITADQFQSTNQLQSAQVLNKEIFVENMHATVTPALEALTGSFQSVGASTADSVKKFDASLGVDVVIVNKECADPATCEHPNYKHILQALGNCDAQSGNSCDQSYINKYYKVGDAGQRLADNNKLKEELGSFTLSLNIRLPKNIQVTEALKKSILNNFKFGYVNYGSGQWGDHRVDSADAPYGLQIARNSEIISSYASFKTYSDSQVLRVFFMGRAWAKSGKIKEAKQMLESGVPLTMKLNIPGVQSREITAKIKPAYTTYVDLYMK